MAFLVKAFSLGVDLFMVVGPVSTQKSTNDGYPAIHLSLSQLFLLTNCSIFNQPTDPRLLRPIPKNASTTILRRLFPQSLRCPNRLQYAAVILLLQKGRSGTVLAIDIYDVGTEYVVGALCTVVKETEEIFFAHDSNVFA